MPERDRLLAVVAEWVEKAENDWTAGSHALKLGEKCPTDTVCFHAQQCVEKYLKALLVLGERDVPKTHNIAQLSSLLPKRASVRLTGEEARSLTHYATAARYPGWTDISFAEARRAVALARRVRAEVRKLLPGQLLRTGSG
ncbi:MAG: HEPN domain-containing protein [Halobacteria archaeon]